jgi:hypothetical protein
MSPASGTAVTVLVEGRSDAAVLRALATRRGIALGVDGPRILPTGGATGAARAIGALDRRPAVVLALCDEREAEHVERVLTGPRDALFVCRADLEDELIRALGTASALDVLAATGDLRSFRTLQGQPDHRDRPTDRQLHRFLAAGAGRKERIGAALAEALDVGAEPPPLRQLLAAIVALG